MKDRSRAVKEITEGCLMKDGMWKGHPVSMTAFKASGGSRRVRVCTDCHEDMRKQTQ